VAAELPGDLWLAVLAIADDQWAWFFSWSRFGPFSGRADSLEAAKEAVAAHVTAEIMTPLWLQYRRWGYALNAAAIPQNKVLVRERRQLVSERRQRAPQQAAEAYLAARHSPLGSPVNFAGGVQ
jgi:hypothetical protein